MAAILSSHQVCARCGWAGVTRAHRLILLSGLAYVIAALGGIAVDTLGVADMRKVVTLPVVVVALFWFFGVPALLWRMNACGGCGQRMAVKLLPGKAPPLADPRGAPDRVAPRR